MMLNGVSLRRRLLIFLLFLSILIVSLLFWIYGFPYFSPLRVDSIPPEAYIVPWATPSRPIQRLLEEVWNTPVHLRPPWKIEEVMAEALKINMKFNLTMPNGTIITVPSTIYLSHDAEFLYIGGIFRRIGKNPYKDPENPNMIFHHIFSIYFDVDNDGTLTYPESGSRLQAAVAKSGRVVLCMYDDLVWSNNYWWYTQDIYDGHPPDFAVGAYLAVYKNSTEDLIILFERRLRCPKLGANALQMRRGERWVMSFLVEIRFGSFHQYSLGSWCGWPRDIRFPNETHWRGFSFESNSSWWPKLVIDLTETSETELLSGISTLHFQISQSPITNKPKLTKHILRYSRLKFIQANDLKL